MSSSTGSTSRSNHDDDGQRDDQRDDQDDRKRSSRRRGHGSDGSAGSEGTGESRRSIVDRQKQEHGGVKIGSAFFGFLTATGVGVLLTALVTAAGATLGVASNAKPGKVASQASQSASTVGIVGAIILLVILFVAYYCGGYVAGRMARFNGMKQGIAVWVWAIVVAIVLAVVAAVAGSQYNILAKLGSFPRIPVNEGTLTAGGIIALLVVVVASLVGAILGGLAGMRFHRKVDKTGLGR